MGLNHVCPNCGSEKVQLTDANHGNGCLMAILFTVPYFIWLFVKYMIAFFILFIWDWWFAIIMKVAKKRYNWISKSLLVRRKKYYCHDCGYNFKA